MRITFNLKNPMYGKDRAEKKPTWRARTKVVETALMDEDTVIIPNNKMIETIFIDQLQINSPEDAKNLIEFLQNAVPALEKKSEWAPVDGGEALSESMDVSASYLGESKSYRSESGLNSSPQRNTNDVYLV